MIIRNRKNELFNSDQLIKIYAKVDTDRDGVYALAQDFSELEIISCDNFMAQEVFEYIVEKIEQGQHLCDIDIIWTHYSRK